MLKRLSIDKGKKKKEKKKEVANMSLLNRKYSYFVGNIYAIFKRNIFTKLSFNLSLLKYRNVWVFWNKKKSGSNRCSPLNNSIDKSNY